MRGLLTGQGLFHDLSLGYHIYSELFALRN